jgi:hypothetical protein
MNVEVPVSLVHPNIYTHNFMCERVLVSTSQNLMGFATGLLLEWGNVINLRGKPFWKRVFPLNPRHRGSLFPKTFKSFRKMAWKKPFFKRVSSKISARMLNLMTLPL